jgi:hypothetical protein
MPLIAEKHRLPLFRDNANLLDRWGKNDEKALEESINAIKSRRRKHEGVGGTALF